MLSGLEYSWRDLLVRLETIVYSLELQCMIIDNFFLKPFLASGHIDLYPQFLNFNGMTRFQSFKISLKSEKFLVYAPNLLS